MEPAWTRPRGRRAGQRRLLRIYRRRINVGWQRGGTAWGVGVAGGRDEPGLLQHPRVRLLHRRPQRGRQASAPGRRPPRAGCRSDGQRGVPSPRRCAGVGDPGRGSPAGDQCRRDHGGRAVGRCGTSRRLSAWGAWLGTGIAHRCDPGDDYGACPREALAHALTRALARPTSGLAPSTTTSPLSPSPSKRRSPMCWRSSGSCSTGSAWTSRTPPRPSPSRSG